MTYDPKRNRLVIPMKTGTPVTFVELDASGLVENPAKSPDATGFVVRPVASIIVLSRGSKGRTPRHPIPGSKAGQLIVRTIAPELILYRDSRRS